MCSADCPGNDVPLCSKLKRLLCPHCIAVVKVPVEDVVPKKSSKERSDLKAGIIGGK